MPAFLLVNLVKHAQQTASALDKKHTMIFRSIVLATSARLLLVVVHPLVVIPYPGQARAHHLHVYLVSNVKIYCYECPC